MKTARMAFFGLLGAAAVVVLAIQLGNWQVWRLSARVQQLEAERAELVRYAERLTATRRVAQIDVLKQAPGPDGRLATELRWQELGSGGLRGEPLTLTAFGDTVYIEALVLKFAPRFVQEGDAQRGASLALFRRVFGNQQQPSSADEFARTARPPLPTGAAQPFEDRLWRRFWEFVDNPRLAEEFGVRVAQIEAPAAPMKPGQIWEVSLDAAGGLNLRNVASRPGV